MLNTFEGTFEGTKVHFTPGGLFKSYSSSESDLNPALPPRLRDPDPASTPRRSRAAIHDPALANDAGDAPVAPDPTLA